MRVSAPTSRCRWAKEAAMTETIDIPMATTAAPRQRKVYVQGPRVRVPFREIALSPTASRLGAERNEPVRLYDTSGPYTDASAVTDIRAGLAPLRRDWIVARGDVEEYDGGVIRPVDDGLSAEH